MARPSLILTLLAVLLGLGATPASAAPLVGIGDQKVEMFKDKRYRWLGIKHARLVVSWNVDTRRDWEQPLVDRWLRAAKTAGTRPLIAFGYDFSRRDKKVLPSARQYRTAVRTFLRRHPSVRDVIAWNEANHCSQPTCNRPERAAEYYDVLKAACRSCRVLAASVLDQRNVGPWVRRFQRRAKQPARLWGLHNYVDVNRLRSTGTQHFLKVVEGDVWLTETGGVVWRGGYRRKIAFEESPEHAGLVTKYVLNLARRTPRIKRVYLYHWNAAAFGQSWDSGLIDPFGVARPGFDVLARFRGRDPAKAPSHTNALPASAPPPNEAPPANEDTKPADQPPPPPPPSEEQPPAEEPPPPPPPCTIPIICPGVPPPVDLAGVLTP